MRRRQKLRYSTRVLVVAGTVLGAACQVPAPAPAPRPTPLVPRLVPAPASMVTGAGGPFNVVRTTGVFVDASNPEVRSIGEMLAAQWQACLDYDSSMRLPTCDVPIHVVAFSEDVQTPPARAREVAELAKTATFHLLEGLGHGSAFGHRPEAVNSCIAEILSQYEDTTA